MRNSDKHLERALSEYNEKVNLLEEKGDPKELLDAYINRGCILSMMDMVVSSIEDFTDAIEIINYLENSGNSVDPGYFVKAYVSRGELQTDSTGKNMVDDYRVAASKLEYLKPGCKYYDDKEIIQMCILCACDLIDNEYPDEAISFIEKGMQIVSNHNDDFSRNAYLELLNLAGQSCMSREEFEQAYKYFSEAVRLGFTLYEEEKLVDQMDLVYSYVSKGDMDEYFSKEEEFFADREAAIEMMEDMKTCGTLDDEELLSNLHGEVAQAYMKKGDVKKAEKHLLKQVSYNLSGSTEYLNENNH